VPGPALLYVRAGCPHCAALRRRLSEQGVVVREIDIAVQRTVIPELLKLTGGRRIVPVLVDEGRIAVAPEGGSEF